MYVLVDIRYVIDNYEKTGCNRLQPVFYGFLKFFKLRQPATEPTAKRGNRNRWSGCFRLRSVRFWCFFRFRELDLQTLLSAVLAGEISHFHMYFEIVKRLADNTVCVLSGEIPGHFQQY
jgi:hypothetical protein